MDTSDIKISDIYARTHNTPGRKPTSTKTTSSISNQSSTMTMNPIKSEPDLSIDHSDADLLPSVSSSFDIPSMDTSHISLSSQFCLSRSNLLIDKMSTISSPMCIKDSFNDIDTIKTEIKEEKLETDVCKQFLRDDDFKPCKPIGVIESKNNRIMYDSKKHSISDALIGSSSTQPSLYTKVEEEEDEDNLSSNAMDSKFHENLLVSSISEPTISLASITTDVKPELKMSNEKLLSKSGINSISFSDKSLKSDSFADLDSIDIMRLPVDLDDAAHIDMLDDIVVNLKPELLQETHACFLSLIRDVFCSTPDHRTNVENLRNKITAWIANPITALNDWFGLSDSWLDVLSSAIHFLAGEFLDQPDDFVPYIEFKANLNIYQWIGAGRDSDQHLKQLCEYWLKRRNEMGVKPQTKHELDFKCTKQNITQSIEETLNHGSLIERVASPPPPRCPTNWIVRKASAEEVAEFRRQERKRFENPHQSFTYRMHGYESVVGPVKGIYTHIPALTKARGHTMLTGDRPSFVTILTLVRDATARLPNGEGTRTEICELLKSSQYISPTASEAVLQTIVSGALDRMHTENDPCVRYDSKRKIWIYLHRSRSEIEFERMHQQFQGVSKHKKKNSRKSKGKISTPQTPENASIEVANILSTSSSNVIPIGTTPKKKVTIKTIPTQGIVAISNPLSSGTQTITSAMQTIPATVKITQPTILSTINSPPVPALSSINSPILSTNPPPLINKIITTQKKTTIIKPELVPIQQFHESNVDQMDIETSLETTPIIISKSPTIQNQAQITGIILDKNQKINSKIIGKPTIGIVSAAPNSAQIKVSTAGGIQTVHVPAGHTLIKPQQNTLIQSSNNQSILTANQIRRPQQTKTMPPLVAAQSPNTNHSYVIPISLGKNVTNVNKTIQPVVVQATKTMSPKTIKTSAVPVLSTNLPRATSLLQSQQPQIVTVSGKTIIRSAASNVTAGKTSGLITGATSSMQFIQAKPMQQQQKIIVAGANVMGNNANKVRMRNTLIFTFVSFLE